MVMEIYRLKAPRDFSPPRNSLLWGIIDFSSFKGILLAISCDIRIRVEYL
jgi:hypothetical protein